MMIRFTTDTVPPSERLEYWLGEMQETVTPFRGEPAGELPFRAEFEGALFGELVLARIAGAGYRSTHGRDEVARSSAHFYAVAVHLAGEVSLLHEETVIRLREGDVFILDSMHEFAFDFERSYSQLIARLPLKWVEARLPRPDLASGSVIPSAQPLGRLIAGYLRAGFEAGGNLSSPFEAMFGQHVCDLVAEACTGLVPESSSSPAWRAATFARARRLIALRFGDPDMRPAVIARMVGVSTRTLQRTFAEHGTTVMRSLLDERVRHAQRLLASTAARHRTVTEIALACGFNDPTHFLRVFTERAGSTPSAWRRERL